MNFTTTRVAFPSRDVLCRGWFYRPDGPRRLGCVVMAHGFGASPDGVVGQTAKRFAEAGFDALMFDYRHFGSSDGQPRFLVNIRRQLQDWSAAIAYVRERGDIDARLIGLWGSSGSGGQVLAVAARDNGVAAVVAQVPYADGLSLARSAGLRQIMRMSPAIARDLLRRVSGRPPYLIDAIAPPGESGAVATRYQDLYPNLIANAPTWANKINASGVLGLYGFRPLRLAHRISCPLLVVLVYHDLIAPAGVAMRAAQGLPYVELALFRGRHFDLYMGDVYERAIRTEIRFFAHHFDRMTRQATCKR